MNFVELSIRTRQAFSDLILANSKADELNDYLAALDAVFADAQARCGLGDSVADRIARTNTAKCMHDVYTAILSIASDAPNCDYYSLNICDWHFELPLVEDMDEFAATIEKFPYLRPVACLQAIQGSCLGELDRVGTNFDFEFYGTRVICVRDFYPPWSMLARLSEDWIPILRIAFMLKPYAPADSGINPDWLAGLL